ncbi:MAG: type II toxin-antitoxin system PemK/MazF family toxin [Maritimibacter sp.]|nr:type II toxin-antitoxin system PemK/MazF family toxin [Maritimibacter sp.]
MQNFTDYPKAGDIVTCRFPRREGPAETPRPCLVLEATDTELLLAYGTTSSTDANVGLEVSVTQNPEAHGLHRPTRFVCARRLRVSRTDKRLVADRIGRVVVGSLQEMFRDRLDEILAEIEAEEPRETREERERAGIHPPSARGFVRLYRKRGKAGKGTRRVTADPDVVVVTRPRPRHRAARLSQTH